MVRAPGFYRLTWVGLPAVGYLYRDEPRPWNETPSERWAVLFTAETLVGPRPQMTTAVDLPDSMIGEPIEPLQR